MEFRLIKSRNGHRFARDKQEANPLVSRLHGHFIAGVEEYKRPVDCGAPAVRPSLVIRNGSRIPRAAETRVARTWRTT